MKESHLDRRASAERLRRLAAEGLYAEAQSALGDYCRVLGKTLAGRPPGDSGLRLLEDEWRHLLEQTRRRTLAGRAHAAARLARLPRLTPHYDEECSPRSNWEFSG